MSGGPVWSRRKFLRAGAVTGAAAAVATQGLAAPAWARKPAASGDTQKVAVIGAGLAGLTAAWTLHRSNADLEITVYEAQTHVGGRSISTTRNGLVYDLGGSFINTDHGDMLTLVDELGLELFNRNKEAAKTKLPGDAYYFGSEEIDEATLARGLRPIQKQISKDVIAVFNDYDANAPGFDELSVADYLDRYEGLIAAPYVRTLLENAIRAEYGAEPEHSTALQLIFLTPEVTGKAFDVIAYSDEEYTVKGGIGEIPDRLTDRIGSSVDLVQGAVLESIIDKGDGLQLSINGVGAVDADWVIVTVPASQLRTIDVSGVGAVPTKFSNYMKAVGLGRNEKLFAQFDRRVWRDNGDFSKGAWTDLGFSAVWDGTQRQIDELDRAALTFYYGGDEVDEVQRGNEVQRGAEAVMALDEFVDGLSDANLNRYLRTFWTTAEYIEGAYVNYRPGQLTEFADYFWIEGNKNFRQDVRFGRLLFAGEHTSDEYYGFMEGGAQSGRLAATTLLEQL